MTLAVRYKTARMLGFKRPVANVLVSRDGGPVRRPVNGRRTIYTGFFIAVKAGFTQMPWESRFGEKAALTLAEVSSRVVSLLAQPHRLEIFIKQQKAPLKYFPDLELKVHPSFLTDLLNGVAFSTAALAPSYDEPDTRLATVVIEIKDERDRRQRTKKYKRKLELAQEVYTMMGIVFLIINRGEDIFPHDLRIASSVVSWRHTDVVQLDVWAAEKTLRLHGGKAPAGVVAAALGVGPVGWAKLRALHVRRIVELELLEKFSPETQVRLLKNNTLKVGVKG